VECTGERESSAKPELVSLTLFSGTPGEKFICDGCERKPAVFDATHTKLHTVVRVSEKAEEKELTIEDQLGEMRRLLNKLIEKGTEGSPSDPLTKGDVQAAVAEARSATQLVPEEVPGATENI